MAASISQTLYYDTIDVREAINKGQIVPVAFEKCPLCCEKRGALLCDVCVNRGRFTHTEKRDGKSFVDKKKEWATGIKQREAICQRFESTIKDYVIANNKRTDIEITKLKISLLKKAIAETKAECSTDKNRLDQDKRKRRESLVRLEHSRAVSKPVLKQKIVTLSEPPSQTLPSLENVLVVPLARETDVSQLLHLAAKTHNPRLPKDGRGGKEGTSIDPKSVPVLMQEANLYLKYLEYQRAKFVRALSLRIFPIEEIFAFSGEDDLLEMSMATALKDACETAFIGGRWVHVGLRGENHCRIVGTSLPDYSGVSSALSLFFIAHRLGSDNPEKIPVGNPGYGIQGAVLYTTMFTTLAANILDVYLPRRCSYRELKEEMSEHDFCNFIWRLNHNILHLVFSQEVKPALIADTLSLQNLLSLLRSPKLGRSGAFMPVDILPVEAELCPLEYESFESEDEVEIATGDVEINRDWERVPAGLPSYETASMGVSSPVDNSMSATGALFSVANAAAASFTGWLSSYYKK